MRKLAYLGFLLIFSHSAYADEKSILDCKGVVESTNATVGLSVFPDTKLPFSVVIKSGEFSSRSPADGAVTPDNGKLALWPKGTFTFWTNDNGGIDGELSYFEDSVTVACRYNQK